MSLYERLFGEPTVAAHLSDDARLQAMLDVEVALAEAQAAVGIVPASCVDPIRDAARADRYDRGALAREAALAGNLAIPLVHHLTRAVASTHPDASRYVHLGATSQDIIDTGLVLQLKAALPALLAQVDRAATHAAGHARRHRSTPQAGRTWLQQATLITFGLKVAGWLDALDRGRRHLAGAASQSLVLQFGGASGTLAALGADAAAVSRGLAERLQLALPAMPWHAHRDRLAHLACALGVLTGTLGKIARDLALLSQTEVAEVYEAPREGRGSSSTMPHKRNPVSAAVALAASVRAPGLVASVLAGMPQEHERGLGGWHAEWEVVPELVLLTAGAARSVADALENLVVDVARMSSNLAITKGLIHSEAVAVELARHIGKPAAHALVDTCCRRAVSEGRLLVNVLVEDAGVTRFLTPDAINARLLPEASLRQGEAFVDAVLAAWKRSEERRGEHDT
jgi:3-carboxy-cis,cis-muconate cycloisomerase